MAQCREESSGATSEESDDELPPTKKLKLPSCVSTLFNAHQDNPAEHQGRQRRVAHVDGNYATLVYLAIPSQDSWDRFAHSCGETLRGIANNAPEVNSSGLDIHKIDPTCSPGWHVSLGPMLMLRSQFIAPFLARLETACKGIDSWGSFRFDADVEIFASQQGGRFFAGPIVSEAYSYKLRNVAAIVKSCCEAFGLAEQQSIDTMRFHCSLAWTCADLEAGLVKCGAQKQTSEWGVSWRVPGAMKEECRLSAPGRALQVKVGERIHEFPFATTLNSVLDASSDNSEDDT